MKNPLLPICILCFTLYSCQKDFSVEIPSSELPTTNILDSSTLSKYVLLDTTMASGLDTGVVVKYTYDNAKRLVKEDYAEYGNTGMPNRLYQTIFYYNGVDTLHYKKIETIFNLPSLSVVKSDTVYYTYAGGRVVSDSFSHSSILVFKYHVKEAMYMKAIK